MTVGLYNNFAQVGGRAEQTFDFSAGSYNIVTSECTMIVEFVVIIMVERTLAV